MNQDLIRREQVRRIASSALPVVLNSLTRELRSYIGMNGTNGGFQFGVWQRLSEFGVYAVGDALLPSGLVVLSF